MLWGFRLNPGQYMTYKMTEEIHISMATMDIRMDPCNNPNSFSHIMVKEGKREYLLCSLGRGILFQQILDLRLMPHEMVTFTAHGTCSVYITGYSMTGPQPQKSVPGSYENHQDAVQERQSMVTSDTATTEHTCIVHEHFEEENVVEVLLEEASQHSDITDERVQELIESGRLVPDNDRERDDDAEPCPARRLPSPCDGDGSCAETDPSGQGDRGTRSPTNKGKSKRASAGEITTQPKVPKLKISHKNTHSEGNVQYLSSSVSRGESPSPPPSTLPSSVLEELNTLKSNRVRIIRRLAGHIFTEEEMLRCNVQGNYGYEKLDPNKMAEIEREFFLFIGDDYESIKKAQAMCKSTVNQYCRHLRQRVKRSKGPKDKKEKLEEVYEDAIKDNG